MCSCKSLAKCILVLVNLVLLLVGGLMLAFGIIAKVKLSLIIDIFKHIPGIERVYNAIDLDEIISGSAIAMIILGAAVAAVGFFGCFGACCENRCLLILYIVAVVLVLLAEVALIIYAAAFPDHIQNTAQKLMKESLVQVKEDVNASSGFYLPAHQLSFGWAILQLGADCCGTYNYTDYSWWLHSVSVGRTSYDTKIPLSCCNKTKKFVLDDVSKYNQDIFRDVDGCLKGNVTSINSKNCYESVFDLILNSRLIVIGVAAAIVGIQLLLIILAACILRRQDSKGA